VKTEDLVLDERGEREVVEKICEVLPDARIPVLAEALVVKAVDLCDLTGLVVPTEDGDALWVANLECDEESYRLNREVSTVHVITCGLEISYSTVTCEPCDLPMNR